MQSRRKVNVKVSKEGPLLQDNLIDISRQSLEALRGAARNRDLDPERVEEIILKLEGLAKSGPATSFSQDLIEGQWRLVFSTATKLRAFQYIPVKEDFCVDLALQRCALESELGPLKFSIQGSIVGWEPMTMSLDFKFTKVAIYAFGNQITEITFKVPKPKTYTFFYVSSDLSLARSSGGGVSLLLKG
jgi:hypothetical protein